MRGLLKNEEITLFSPHAVPGLYDVFGTEKFDDLYLEYENNPDIPKNKGRCTRINTCTLKGESRDR